MKGSVNTSRVLMGGLAAGLLMSISEFLLNEVVLVEQMAAEMDALGLPVPGGSTIALFVALTFGVGIAMVWLYAMLRSHSGPGPRTAVCAGMFVFFLYAVTSNTFFWGLGFASSGVVLVVTAWMLVEVLAGALVGAYLYQD